jgi:replication factor A1
MGKSPDDSGPFLDTDGGGPVSRVADIHPTSTSLNLVVKFVSVMTTVAVRGTTGLNMAGEVLVGDASGTVLLFLRGSALSLAAPGAVLWVRSASARVFKGIVRLYIDEWGRVEPSEADFDVNLSTGISSVEHELVSS